VSGTVALTYDDGPDPTWTHRVLDLLRRRQARATFFVMTPRAVANHGPIEAMLADGHEVGLHCHQHVRHSQLSERELTAELATALRLLKSVGVTPRAWRTPWGVETVVTRRLAARHGLRLWGWNLDSHDWRGDSAASMFASLQAQGGLRGGDVVLMHDGLGPGARRTDCAQTLALTDLLLAAAERDGLHPASVSECAGVMA
jgi:peptidoglycan/xylan/chitin deacetylase (PgdA/CDA1 family)